MTYYTGDIHGSPEGIMYFCERHSLTEQDTIIILGDVGANYYGDERDERLKNHLSSLKPTFLCIHGNHEKRPSAIPLYILKEWNGGLVWIESEYPNILFAKDGEIYEINGIRHIAIGGAYSVDKPYRLSRGYGWWPDEQPSEDTKRTVEQRLSNIRIDVILSHTCPFRYIPHEAFISGVEQSQVDNSTELWLDSIESSLDYVSWFCGHWHIDKHIDKMHFLFHGFECYTK